MFSDTRHIAVALAGLGAFLNLYAPQAILPLLAEEFSASPAEIATTMTACTLAIALTAPFTGVLADVVGHKRMIATALIALLVPTVMVAFSASLEAVIAWRFVQGLLLPPIFTVIIAYIGGEWPADQATGVTGIYTAAAGFGGFLGRFLTGTLADSIGWRGAFLADAAVTAICAAGVILLLPRERNHVRAESLRASLAQMLAHLRNPQLVATYAVGFGVLFNFIAIFTYVGFLLAAPPYDLSATLIGSIFVVYLVTFITTPMTGFAVRMFGRRNLVIGAVAIWAFGAALTLAPQIAIIVIGLTLCAICGFMVQTSSTSFVASHAASGKSSAVGLYGSAFYVGGSVGAFLPGLAWQAGGFPAAIGMVVAMLAIMGMIVVLLWPK
ncbi:MAG: MFS transporter [Pseudorhodoplanes sp.]|nr:MFS transporter [Pseudorhodoplanes sp.]